MAIQQALFFSTTLTKAELLPADKTVTAGIPARLGKYDIAVGKLFGWGRGLNLGLKATEGRFYVDVRDTSPAPGAEIDGTLRLIALDQLEQEAFVYFEVRTEQARLGATELSQRVILPALDPIVQQGFSVALVLISDVNATVGAANSKVLIDGRRARTIAG